MAEPGASQLPAISRLVDFVVADSRMLEMLFEYIKVSEVESEELATALVFLFSQKGRGRNLLEQALRSGMRHYPNGRMLREMNFSVSVLSEYVRCWGKRYLRTVLKAPLQNLLSPKTRVEIDPKRLGPGERVEDNRAALIEQVGQIIRNITATRPPAHIESALRLLLASLRESEGTCSLSGYLLTSTFLFLRFFCPAIVSPDLYGLRKKKKNNNKKKGACLSKEQQRKLVLTAKVLQNIANHVVTSEKEDYLSDLGGFVQESMARIREWATQYLEVGLSTPRGPSQTEEKKMKKGETEPYMQKMGAFLMKNEDNIRKYFESEGDQEREKGRGKRSEECIATCDSFLEHMDDIRKEIGGNPQSAESYEKVWERVQRRMQRMEQLQKLESSKHNSLQAATPTTAATDNTSTIIDSQQDAGARHIAVRVFSGLSLSLGDDSAAASHPDQSSGSLTFSTGDDDRDGDVDDATTESGLDDVQELEDVRDSLLSRTDINPDGKAVFKCWQGKTKKMLVLPLSTVNYDELCSAVAKKLCLAEAGAGAHTFKLISYGQDQDPPTAITNNATFSRFLQTSGTMAENTIVFSLRVVLEN